jgi:transposase InsO family protein
MEDNGTGEFHAALSRFLSLYPAPQKIKSDHGTQIKATYRAVASFLAERGIEWTFSLTGHPASNGSAEAAVKLVKRQVDLLTRQRKVTDSVMRTCLRKAQLLVNTRPIGSRGVNQIKITPYDFLDGALSRLPADIKVNDDLPIADREKYMSDIFNRLWEEIQRTFFSERVERRRKYQERQHVEVGDVVAVRELNSVRGKWTLGRVREVHRSGDGLVRSAKVEKPDHSVVILGINRLSIIVKAKQEE